MSYGKIDKKKFMTLENTVDTLIDAVNLHYDVDRVLTDFGIRVLGRVNYTNQIPGYGDNSYTGKFGDAYLVSQNSDSSTPYDIYIWTRLTPDSVEPNGYWLDIGLLSTVGPQGPQGERGPQGPQGENTRWYIYKTLPQSGDFKPGDVCLLPSGDVYMYVSVENGWSNASQVNIKGQTGTPGTDGQTPYIGSDGTWWIGIQSTGVRAEGRDGANGTPGTAILIQGKLSSASLLPDAATAPRNYGYLISVDGTVRLYFIAGMEGEENWQYIEYSGNGTIVTTDGVAQSTWDTNTKLDKTTGANKIYATDANGLQTALNYGYSANANYVPLRIAGGNIGVPETPGSDNSAASKKYVDDLAATKLTKPNNENMARGTFYAYTTNDRGETITPYKTDPTPTSWTIPIREQGGALGVGTPTADIHAATKKYVDDAIASACGDYEIGVVVKSATGQAATLNVSDLVDIVPNTTVQINVDIDMSDITVGPPNYSCTIGNTSVGLSQNQYYGFPVMTNNYDLYSCHVTCTGTLFKAVPIDQEYGSVASGTTFNCGVYAGGAGTNTITATYIKYK